MFGEKAEVIEYDHQVIRTPRTEYRAPSVIRLQHHIRRPRPRVKLSRREVFARDRHTCQYCGRQAHDLTLDHVVPRHRGGGHTWENLVAACKPCNHRKGGKTLEEARLRLLRAAVRAAQRHLLAVHAVPRRRAQRGLAHLPVPGSQLTGPSAAIEAAIPAAVATSLRCRSGQAGHAAYVVGGSLRDVVLGRDPTDWDLATDALPERVVELFPDAVYENRFGTVAVRRDGEEFEITTFRTDHDYADFRRPHRVEFGDSIELDLARRDFTVNAMAWGARPGEPPTPRSTRTAGPSTPSAGVLRAVGDPATRFEEDALRMVRAVRLAATLGFEIEPATLAAIRDATPSSSRTSRASGSRPSSTSSWPHRAVGRAAAPGRDRAARADLARARGAARRRPEQDPRRGPVGPHAAHGRRRAGRPADRPARRPAPRHRQAGDVRRRPLPRPRRGRRRAGRAHSSTGCTRRAPCAIGSSRSSATTCSATSRAGPTPRSAGSSARWPRSATGALDDLLALREADNVGQGLPADAGRLDELRARVAAELAAGSSSTGTGSPIDGDDLMAELGLEQGPLLGRSSTSCSSGSSPTRRSTTPTLLAAVALRRPVSAAGRAGATRREVRHDVTEADRDRAPAPGRARAVGRAARPGRDALPPGRARPIRGTRSRSSGWRASRSTGATSSRRSSWRGRAWPLDPENVAAQRMVERLEEVLAFQGVRCHDTCRDRRPVVPHADGARPVRARPTRRSLVDRLLRRR